MSASTEEINALAALGENTILPNAQVLEGQFPGL